MQLTGEQEKIVKLNFGQHLVLAPPGTGKTELVVQRLSNAVKSGIKQDEMICLTFTNRAALNMIDRVEKDIGNHEIFIGNIHSFCNTFLRKYKLIPQNISLLDEEDVQLLFGEIKKDYKCWVVDKYKKGNDNIREINTNELLSYNTFLKQNKYNFPVNILQKVDIRFKDYDEIAENKEIAHKICARYEEIKKESNFIDFDDLLTLTYNYFLLNPVINSLYKWLQIDEVQDLNPLQWAIINSISNKEQSHRIFFGDYEQAIFSFMGAKLEILDKVALESTVHQLENNFRSPQYLLDLYIEYAKKWLNPKWLDNPKSINNLEQQSSSLIFKEILLPHVEEVKVGWEYRTVTKEYSTEQEEVDWIVQKYLPNEPKERTAILVRNNVTADLFAKGLHANSINYFKISGFDLFRRQEIKDLMAFLSIISNDNDRNSWIRTFHVYAKTKSLSESRSIINNMFKLGIKPLDFTESFENSFLDDCWNTIQNDRIIVFDTETTGLDTSNDDIIQIAAIEIINGQLGRTFEVYIDTDKDLTESEKIHHISKKYLEEHSIDGREALSNFIDFVGNDTLVAHNLDYDYKILNSNLSRVDLNTLENKKNMYDSIEIARRIYPSLPSYKLEYLLNHLNIEGVNSHNALDDVKATVNLLLSLSYKISDNKQDRIFFLESNKKHIDNFQKQFTPLYKILQSNFTTELSLNEIVDMIFGYMENNLTYKIKDDIYEEITKLTRHMKSKCTVDEALISIKKYIPEYVKYKESDLVLGNEKIIIATIHKAKGLEFENVIIPGCTDGNFPSYFSTMDGKEAIIEDARLLYVAMTRTKKRLLITSHTMKIIPTKRGPWKLAQKPSRFLKPIMEFFR
jgi:DNA helicase II / ATP-dependent DNA helicase PcrA